MSHRKKYETSFLNKKIMLIGRVYMIISPSGRIYIGSTKQTFEARWRHYFKLSCKQQIKLYNSLKCHGPENHKFYKLWEGDIKDMFSVEAILGRVYNVLDKEKGLNLSLPKESDLFSGVSTETKEKMSKSHTGMKHSPETIAKMGKSPYYQTEEFKNKTRLVHTGKIVTDETRDKMSSARKGKYLDIIQKMADMKVKTVIQMDLESNFIKEWRSMSDVQKELKIDKSQICSCCKNKSKSAGGFKWKYKIIN